LRKRAAKKSSQKDTKIRKEGEKFMEKSILYLDSVGETNTEAVVEAAAKRAAELKLLKILVFFRGH